MRIAIIGFGNMGKTYANSFMSSGFVGASDILILNRTNIEENNNFGIDSTNFYFGKVSFGEFSPDGIS